MDQRDTEIVSAIRMEIAEQVGTDRFELWFGNSVQFQVKAKTLRVEATDQFILDRINNSFLSILKSCATSHLGDGAKVTFLKVAESDADESTVAPLPKSRQASARSSNQSGQGLESNSTQQSVQHPQMLFEALPDHGSSASPKTKPRRRAAAQRTDTTNGPQKRFARFDSVVEGDHNRLAVAASRSLTNKLGKISPLYIHGPSGSGKTQLLESIWTEAGEQFRGMRKVYLSAEQFTTYFLDSLRGSGLPSFRRKYRGVQLLMIDDIQFFTGKQATLVEFQHTMDTLAREGYQLVVTADRPPAQLKGFGPDLVARLSGGLVCEIEQADAVSRAAIIKQYSKSQNIPLPKEVIALIANRFPGDARQLQGAVNRLDACSNALLQPITLEFAEQHLQTLMRSVQPVIRMSDIDQAVCDVFGLESKTLQSARKTKAVNQPRMLAMWLARKYTRAAYSEIGHYFGKRTHSTAIAAQKKVDKLVQSGDAIQMAGNSCSFEDALRQVERVLKTG